MTDENAIQRIRTIIRKKDEKYRDATWEEMDAIEESFKGQYSLEAPNFLNNSTLESIDVTYRNGRFIPGIHAPNGFAFKQYMFNCFMQQSQLTKHIDIKTRDAGKSLLNLSWFARTKENFDWAPLIDGLVGHSDRASAVMNIPPILTKYNVCFSLIERLEKEMFQELPNKKEIISLLKQLHDNLCKDERRNIFIELFMAIVGVVSAPIALLIGLVWLIPAYYLELPYFGKPEFFFDVAQWFIDSFIKATRCIVFPIYMIRAYNNTGSMDPLKGECTRIVDTLRDRFQDNERTDGSLQLVTPTTLTRRSV